MDIFLDIATKDGTAYTEFGPCFCTKDEYCISCKKADEIEAAGLDWDEEHQKFVNNQ